MAVFRIEKTRDYTVMSNHHLRNAGLSLKSKGLLSMMLSLPEDWNYTTRGLAKICKEETASTDSSKPRIKTLVIDRKERGPIKHAKTIKQLTNSKTKSHRKPKCLRWLFSLAPPARIELTTNP